MCLGNRLKRVKFLVCYNYSFPRYTNLCLHLCVAHIKQQLHMQNLIFDCIAKSLRLGLPEVHEGVLEGSDQHGTVSFKIAQAKNFIYRKSNTKNRLDSSKITTHCSPP